MDPILYWNEVALEANRVSHTNGKNEQTGPTLSSRALAIVHLAMYDAYAGSFGYPAASLPAYLKVSVRVSAPTVPAGVSKDDVAAAAVAAAAHATMSALFPSQKVFLDQKHLDAGLSGNGLSIGHAFGLAVAQAVLTERKDDDKAGDDGYAASMARTAHRPDPDNPQGYHGPFYGARTKKLFAATTRHTLDIPPRPGDAAYLKALREVRGKGIAPELMGTLPAGIPGRTVDQTLIGIYWGYDGAAELGTPPRLYNQIIRKVAAAQENNVAENAKLFALVNAAMGDAGILAWEQKYFHDLWRPMLGIREHDDSMGPAGTQSNNINDNCDPGWLPLGAPKSNSKTMEKNFTPPFPAYPSGHASFGAAAFHVARLFYGRPSGLRRVQRRHQRQQRRRSAQTRAQLSRWPVANDRRKRSQPCLSRRALGLRCLCREEQQRSGFREEYRWCSARTQHRRGYFRRGRWLWYQEGAPTAITVEAVLAQRKDPGSWPGSCRDSAVKHECNSRCVRLDH
jgi:Vanadium chloroperoxidase N-terminal domain